MKVEQIYTGCLAQGAYYITSGNEAAIVDPLREIKPYIERLEKDGVKLKYVLETHFHADFVSGHIDLANATGAKIVFGPNAKPNYDVHIAQDNEILTLGDVKIKVLHTPGHTMESTTFLLIDEKGVEHSIFTGDTLFIGDVGRPDLAVKSDLTVSDLASHLYDSLHNKIMPLHDEVIVYPGHGAGSACGKMMSKETIDTLGNQKKNNYALQPMSKEEFISQVTTGLTTPPQYFPKNVMMNKEGYMQIDDVLNKGLTALTPRELEAVANETGALILDTRDAQTFAKGFIPNSINIGLDGSFAPWVGALIVDIKQPILLIADEGREEEAVTRLSRVGYDYTLGYLNGGVEAWKNDGFELDNIRTISAETFAKEIQGKSPKIIDVRKNSEFLSEHIVGAENMPLDNLNDYIAAINNNENYYLHCAGGYRSMITLSILKSRGFDNITDVAGGFKAIKETDVQVSEYVCPTTLL
jgi:glyoxylase-like metal-dependent hydrolase (beta-lactamase superfamily II)/rhodanese-related sulfurtransferase